MAAQVRIRLCSVLTVETADRTLTGHDLGSRKARTLLALLASERGRLVPLDQVVDVLWPTGRPRTPPPTSPRWSAAADGCSVTACSSPAAAPTGWPRAPAPWTSTRRARWWTRRASRLAAGEPALAAAAARRALDLLGSPPALPDEADADWVLHVRREADELRRKARHLLAEGADVDRSRRGGRRSPATAVAADPYDERAVRDLMRAQVADGSVAAALSAYDELAGRLREDLGIDPAAETARLHLAILREEAPAGRARPGRPRAPAARGPGRS